MNLLKFIDQNGLLSTNHYNQITFTDLSIPPRGEEKLQIKYLYLRIRKNRSSEIFKIPVATTFSRIDCNQDTINCTAFKQSNIITKNACRDDKKNEPSKILSFLDDKTGIIVTLMTIVVLDTIGINTISVKSEIVKVEIWSIGINNDGTVGRVTNIWDRFKEEIDNLKFDIVAASLNRRVNISRIGSKNEKSKSNL